MTDGRSVRRQLRINGELLLRARPPGGGGALRPAESSTWSEHWTAFYADHPHLRPVLEGTATLPRERLREELAGLLDPEREVVLVASVHGHPDAVGVRAAAVTGPGDAVAAYVADLVDDGRQDLFVLDELAGTAVHVDTDDEDTRREVVVRRFRWPEVED